MDPVPEHRDSVGVLVIDDDLGVRESSRWALTEAGVDVTTAESAAEGLWAVRSWAYDVAVVDFRLPDMSGIDLIRCLRDQGSHLRPILISGFLTTDTTVEAMRLGASDVLEKPVTPDALLAAVRHALVHAETPRDLQALPGSLGEVSAAHRPARQPQTFPGSAAHRWAMHALKVCASERDPKTLREWAETVGVSYSSLCESCRLVGIRPRDARDLVRVLRAMIKSRAERCRPEVLLDLGDRRTLDNLLDRTGLSSWQAVASISLERYLESQRFADGRNEGVRALRALLVTSSKPAH